MGAGVNQRVGGRVRSCGSERDGEAGPLRTPFPGRHSGFSLKAFAHTENAVKKKTKTIHDAPA